MSTRLSLLAATLSAAASLTAQNTFTSPAGVAGIEGTETFAMFNNRHLQGLDNTVAGPIANISSIAFRRDGESTATGGVARTMDVLLVMGVGNFATHTNNYSTNFSSSTVAIATRNVNFPNWVPVPATPPAPFDFVLPFDQPWTFPGGGALIWDITCTNSSATGTAPMDRHGWSSTLGVSGDNLGTGCISTGRTGAYSHALTLYNEGPTGNMSIRWSGSNAPSAAATVINFDFFDANLPFPGLCTTLHSLGSVVSTATPTPSSTGSIAATTRSFPYDANAVGLTLVTQLISLDAGQAGIPVSLSNGERGTMPPYLDVAYVWSSSTTSATGTLITPGTIPVTQFTY
jgi:hypothetical protein